jgi:hypothetical protein
MNEEPQQAAPDPGAHSSEDRRLGPPSARLELPEAAHELLAIVAHLGADDGPIQTMSRAGELSPWHAPVLDRALEGLEVIDHFLRGRVAFYVAGREHGYGSFEEQSALAGASLDACRCAARVVDALLGGRLPSEAEFEALAVTVDRIYPALRALEECDG